MSATILQVIPSLGSGGVEIETLEIAKAIIDAGGKSYIATNLKNSKPELPDKNIKVYSLPLDSKNPIQISKNIRALKALIEKESIDIVHVRSRAPAWSAYKASRALGVPFVTTYHAAYKSNTIFKTFYNSVMARGDRVIAISEFIKNHIMSKYKRFSWFDPKRICLINRGIDLNEFNPANVTKARLDKLRKAWNILPGTQVILLPGRISRSKGQSLLVKALSLMKHSDVTALFVGSAQGHENLKDQILQYAESLDLSGRVKWAPPCPDMPAAYLLADLIVCPSLTPEGFGRVMAEAQAMKKPIIASNHGAALEVIENQVTGWLIPSGDAAALAKFLDDALDLPIKQREEMGEKGRIRMQSFFSKESMASKTIALYQNLMDKKR